MRVELVEQNPLKQAVESWLSNQLSKHTKDAYRRDMRDFMNWLTSQNFELTDSIKSLQPQHIIEYRQYLDVKYARASTNRKFSTIVSCFSWLEAMRVVLPNPCKHIKAFPQPDNANTEALSDKEAKRLLEACAVNPMDYAAISLMLYLGVRVGELIAIQMSDMGDDRGAAILTIHGKGHKVRVLPLPRPVRFAVKRWLQLRKHDDKHIFPVHSTTIFRSVKKYSKLAGITKSISPHSLRATAVSNALEQGANPVDVQNMCGWSSVKMINRYDKRDKIKNSAVHKINYGGK